MYTVVFVEQNTQARNNLVYVNVTSQQYQQNTTNSTQTPTPNPHPASFWLLERQSRETGHDINSACANKEQYNIRTSGRCSDCMKP